MITAGENLRAAMERSRAFKAYAEVTFKDGGEASIGDKEIVVSGGGNTLSDSAGVGTFPVGEAVCRSVTLEILPGEDLAGRDFFDAEIRLSTSLEDTEKIPLGSFTVTEAELPGMAGNPSIIRRWRSASICETSV